MKHSRSLIALLCLAGGLSSACATEAGSQLDLPGSEGSLAATLELSPPAQGFQIDTLGGMLEPGDDVRMCEVVVLPGPPDQVYYIDRIEAAMTERGRDLIVSAAPPGSQTAAIMDIGDRVPCTRAGEAFGEELTEVLSARHLYLDRRFPEGVGKVLHGGQKIAIDYHFWNDGEERAPALVKLNFHTTEGDAMHHVAHTASFHNLTIYTPPHGESAHVAECVVSQPLLVGELVRRTERHGTDFKVWLSGGQRDGELLWHSTDPRDSELELPEPLLLEAGEGFRFECAYENPSDLELRFGVNAGDEMCTLNAMYWQADPELSPERQGCLLLEVDADGVAR